MSRHFERSLGNETELLMKQFFESKGYEFFLSEDKFDDRKDAVLVVDGKRHNVEVKLESRYRKFNSFTVPITTDSNTAGICKNQLSKCVNVDVLIFCQRPEKEGEGMNIYQAPPVGSRQFEIKQNSVDKRFVAHFPIDKMRLVGIITNESIINKFIIRKGAYAKSC